MKNILKKKSKSNKNRKKFIELNTQVLRHYKLIIKIKHETPFQLLESTRDN